MSMVTLAELGADVVQFTTYDEAFAVVSAIMMVIVILALVIRWLLGFSVDEMLRPFFFLTCAPLLLVFAYIMLFDAVPNDQPQGDFSPDDLVLPGDSVTGEPSEAR